MSLKQIIGIFLQLHHSLFRYFPPITTFPFQVFCLADFLQISNLRNQCEDVIFSTLNIENCVELANFSSVYSTIVSQYHKDEILEFLLCRWNYIIETNTWTDLKYEILRKLVISDEFNVKNEEQVLSAVLGWVSAKPTRVTLLQSLLQDVRLHAVSEKVLDKLEGHPLVRSLPECSRLIDEGRFFASNVKCDTTPIRLKPRTYMDKSVCVFCLYKTYPPEVLYPRPDFSNVACPHSRDTLSRQYDSRYNAAYCNKQSNNCNVLVYSKIHDHWEQPMDEVTRSWAQDTAMATQGYSVYLLGNRQWEFDNMSHKDEVYDGTVSFDRLSQTWEECGNLPFPVMFNSCGSVRGRLFSCGGLNLARSVGAYCIPTLLLSTEDGGQWDYMNDMLCARRHHGAAALQDRVYVAGGKTKGEDLNPCSFSECWDPETNGWVKIPNPWNNRSKLSVCTTPDRFFILGGFNLSPEELCYDYTWECYDPREGKWSNPLVLPGKYFDFRTAYLDNEVYMIGGSTSFDPYGDEVWSRDVNVLDLRAMKWRAGAPLPLRAPPELSELDEILSGLSGVETPNIPIPTGTAVLT